MAAFEKLAKYMAIGLTTTGLLIGAMGIDAGIAQAHPYKHSEGYSSPKHVNDVEVSHKHVKGGTICKIKHKDGSVTKDRLVALNGTNGSCAGAYK